MRKIRIASDFSRFPAGRFYADGPFSGEKFREEVLKAAFAEGGDEGTVIELDGTEGYGSSFLEEAFGGMVRKRYASADDLHKRLRIVTRDPSYERQIWSYIDRAASQQARAVA